MDRMTIFLIFLTGLTAVLTLQKVIDHYAVHSQDLKNDVFAGETFDFSRESFDDASNEVSGGQDFPTVPNEVSTGQTENSASNNATTTLKDAQNNSEFEEIFQSSAGENTETSEVMFQDNTVENIDANSGNAEVNHFFENSSDQTSHVSAVSDMDTTVTSSSGSSTESSSLSSYITLSLVEKAGFRNVGLQPVHFDGFLFQILNISDDVSLEVAVQNLQRNGQTEAAFYQFLTRSRLLAEEVYRLLKEQFYLQHNLSLNETNEFGDGSFYINFSTPKENVFLVVKKGESLYALTYEKAYHPFIKQLLQLLP